MYSQLFPPKHGFLHISVSEYCNIGEYCIIVIKLLLHWVNTRREGLIVSIKVFELKIIDTIHEDFQFSIKKKNLASKVLAFPKMKFLCCVFATKVSLMLLHADDTIIASKVRAYLSKAIFSLLQLFTPFSLSIVT